MTDTAGLPNRIPWPPMIYLAAIVLGIILHIVYPLPFIGPPFSDLLFAIGWLLIVAVVAIDVSAIRTLHRAKTTIMPHRASEHLVTSGAFSFSRNPLYLANTLLMFAIGLVGEVTWFLPLGLLAAYLTGILAIKGEERHLTTRFGKKYLDYSKRVRRWI
ncbi:isoprenylcysteine carboxylmethyltransferase family protein [Mesorhizobium sp. NBSH29]|uniref:methyltransferase family protein n=1 Tax=Mesorhizobium sp. NBSH29 TaxID=2654249 RepID=UPI0018965509|nr:isoprenylcysteine carboxylmethyltransferase family protein [Mesorhizobium sp. NBSH29]QPC87487.1 isoprenylcysteine carboxylmethyltransferase family protein [Mesorhizobium sp. NBSH29]